MLSISIAIGLVIPAEDPETASAFAPSELLSVWKMRPNSSVALKSLGRSVVSSPALTIATSSI